MILSINDAMDEYDIIRQPDHIARVWDAVERTLPEYWRDFLKHEQQATPLTRLADALGGTVHNTEQVVLSTVFRKAIESYNHEAAKYRAIFDPEGIDEFRDDPNAFKLGLARDVPIIANTLRSRNADLRKWQIDFNYATPGELLDCFAAVLEFRDEWSKTHPSSQYRHYNSLDDFGLSPLDDDEAMSLANVVGMGIKSMTLFHLDSERLPPRGRNGLYGLFFLSGKDHFGLPSQSSEFLMIDDKRPATDGSFVMDQNYWYPYDIFSLYALRVYRWIAARVEKAGFSLDPSFRYVYVDRFFSAVCDRHVADLKTMRAHERFEVPA